MRSPKISPSSSPTQVVHEHVDAFEEQQKRELSHLKEQLSVANENLKSQQAVVKSMIGEVYVPQDVVKYAQLKLKASRECKQMQDLQLPALLDKRREHGDAV